MPLEIPTKDKECIFRPSFMKILQGIFGCYPKPNHIEAMRTAIKNSQIQKILDNTYGIIVPLEAKLCRIWLKYGSINVHIIALEYPEKIHPQLAFKGN